MEGSVAQQSGNGSVGHPSEQADGRRTAVMMIPVMISSGPSDPVAKPLPLPSVNLPKIFLKTSFGLALMAALAFENYEDRASARAIRSENGGVTSCIEYADGRGTVCSGEAPWAKTVFGGMGALFGFAAVGAIASAAVLSARRRESGPSARL